MKNYIVAALTAAVAATLSGGVLAASDAEWNYNLSPYIWFAGSSGEVSSIPGQPAIPFDLSAEDALKDNEASYMLIFQGKKERHGFLLDFMYTDTQYDEDVVPAVDLKVQSISKNTILSAAYVYEVHNNGGTVVDVFGGVRYWDIDSTLKFKGGLGVLAGMRIENSEDWIDPIGGLNVLHRFEDSKLYIKGWLAVGGFNVGSDLFYDTSINVGYQWSDSIATTLGYRIYEVDYDDNGFVYDVKNDGLALGLAWRF